MSKFLPIAVAIRKRAFSYFLTPAVLFMLAVVTLESNERTEDLFAKVAKKRHEQLCG